MRVTAIIPTYNRREKTLDALASVAAQTRPAFEVIVVDDGSDDGTFDALAAADFGVDFPLRTFFQNNHGPSAARNAGIRAARGEWIAFLDSDDRWTPDKLARQTAFMERTGATACHTDEIWERGGRRVNPGVVHAKGAGNYFARALQRCVVSPSTTIIGRKLLFRAGLFDESLPACEDYDLWLKLFALDAPPILLPEALTIRRGGRPDQLSAQVLGQDLHRIRSLAGILGRGGFRGERRTLAVQSLKARAELYIRGCLKHDRPETALYVRELVSPFTGALFS